MKLSDRELSHYRKFMSDPFSSYKEPAKEIESFGIAGYRDAPCKEAVTLATYGIAGVKAMSSIKEHLNQELILSFWGRCLNDELLDFFATTSAIFLQEQKPLKRGERIRFKRFITPQTKLNYAYVTQPTYFDQEFAAIDDGKSSILLRWLVPIYAEEAEWIDHKDDIDAFENLLIKQDPDLLNLHRPPINLP